MKHQIKPVDNVTFKMYSLILFSTCLHLFLTVITQPDVYFKWKTSSDDSIYMAGVKQEILLTFLNPL